jgi:hypothetical protein
MEHLDRKRGRLQLQRMRHHRNVSTIKEVKGKVKAKTQTKVKGRERVKTKAKAGKHLGKTAARPRVDLVLRLYLLEPLGSETEINLRRGVREIRTSREAEAGLTETLAITEVRAEMIEVLQAAILKTEVATINAEHRQRIADNRRGQREYQIAGGDL